MSIHVSTDVSRVVDLLNAIPSEILRHKTIQRAVLTLIARGDSDFHREVSSNLHNSSRRHAKVRKPTGRKSQDDLRENRAVIYLRSSCDSTPRDYEEDGNTDIDCPSSRHVTRQSIAMQEYTRNDRRTRTSEGLRRLSMLGICFEVDRLAPEHSVSQKDISIAVERFSKLANTGPDTIWTIRKASLIYITIAAHPVGLGLLLMLGQQTRDLFEHQFTQKICKRLLHRCEKDEPGVMHTAAILQPIACKLLECQFRRRSVDTTELSRTQNILSQHFQSGDALGTLLAAAEQLHSPDSTADLIIQNDFQDAASCNVPTSRADTTTKATNALDMTPNADANTVAGLVKTKISVLPRGITELMDVAEQARVTDRDVILLDSRRSSAEQVSSSVARAVLPSLPMSPPDPTALLLSENLLHDISAHFNTICQLMRFDADELLLTAADFDLCSKFDSYCFAATIFRGKGLSNDFGKALNQACSLIKPILQADHPRTLACFFEVFVHIVQCGIPEVVRLLCFHIAEMSAQVSGPGHLLGIICGRLAHLIQLEPNGVEQAMVQVWKCMVDVFDNTLGSSHRLAVSVRLDHVKRVTQNYQEEELLIRRLHSQLGEKPTPAAPRVLLNLAHNLNKQGQHGKAEEIALEVTLLLRDPLFNMRVVERIETLKIISHSHFHRGESSQAEQTMQHAIQAVVNAWGRQHPWFAEFQTVLEGWLREWGRAEDADSLQEKVSHLLDAYVER